MALFWANQNQPPSAHTRDEHRRRELLKHTTGTWQITPQNGQSTTRNSRFSLSIGKIFQRQHQNQFQGSSQYIQRHILSFTFGDLVGYGCSVANAKLVNDRLKIVFSWRALQEASVEQSSTSKSDRRSLKLIFDRYSLEGYLYGSTSIEEGYVFYGTYSAELTPAQQPEKWQQEYDACRR